MLKSLEKSFSVPSKSKLNQAKAFLLFTAGSYDAPQMSPEERLSRDALLRLLKTVELKKEYPQKPLFIVGGNSKASNHKEASYYKEVAEKLGVKGKIVIVENVYDTLSSIKVLKKFFSPNTPLVLITSAYHLKRSLYLFEKEGFSNIIPYPSNYDYKVCTPHLRIWDFFPQPLYLEMTNKAVHEYLGLLYYRLKYR